MNNYKFSILIGSAFLLSACTQNSRNTLPDNSTAPSTQTSIENSITPSPTVSPTPPPGCFYQQVQCVQAPCNPVLVCPSSKPKSTSPASVKPKASSTSTPNNTSSSNTNINIQSNSNNVQIINKNGKRYASLNGQEVELDANGCYDYDQNGTKIHACINN